jgi:hypothetical protein
MERPSYVVRESSRVEQEIVSGSEEAPAQNGAVRAL